MKNLITYLKTLWSSMGNLQSSDVSLDRRLTVGSPSGLDAKLMLKLVSVLVLILTIGSGNVWGAAQCIAKLGSTTKATVNISSTNHSSGTADVVSWSATNSSQTTTQWRFGESTTPASITFSVSTGYQIVSVVMATGATYLGTWSSNAGSMDGLSCTGINASSVTLTTTTKARMNTITVTYEEHSSCDKSVTIQKGAETNGTFTLSPSDSQASCDGVAVTVTPTPASSAYYCSAVSASTGETGTDNGNGTWTVNIAPNTTGTFTINVTFSLKTSYTVTWYNEGASIGTESVYSGDKVSALPSPAPTSSCSGEFIGWVRSDAAVADKSVTDAYTIQPTAPTLFTDVAGSPTITGNTAFHAVYRMPKPD